MPVEVIKYTCQFKCFKKAVSERNRMVGHEAQCWNNPDNETCKTCKNQIAYTESGDSSYWPVRGCKIAALDETFEQLYEHLRHGTSLQVRPVYHCKYHNKDDDGGAKDYSEELLKEYGTNNMGTHHFPYHQPIAEGKFDLFGNPISEQEVKLSVATKMLTEQNPDKQTNH